MRKIIFDTETTGLSPQDDKIIEVGCVELINDIPTGKTFHRYYNPSNVIISEQSLKIHGLSNKFLSNYPSFENSVDELLNFIEKSILIIHNAAFDISMVNHTLKELEKEPINPDQFICTLEISKKRFPGSKVNLNALCRRFNISLDSREKHGALTDCFLLAQVYLELIGGRQRKIDFDSNKKTEDKKDNEKTIIKNHKTSAISIRISKDNIKNHQKMLKKISDAKWYKYY